MRQALRRLHSAIDTTRELWSMANPFAAQLADALEASWPAVARPNQLPPPGDCQVWLLLAGRGFGKTRTLAEWVCHQARECCPTAPPATGCDSGRPRWR